MKTPREDVMSSRVLLILAIVGSCLLLLHCKAENPVSAPVPAAGATQPTTVSDRVTVRLKSSRETVAANGAQRATITATVTKVQNGQNVPQANVQVQFSFTPQLLGGIVGKLTPAIGTTDAAGKTTLERYQLQMFDEVQ